MTTYAEAITHPDARNLVFAIARFRKQFYAWVASGTSGIWYQETLEPVDLLRENDADATECASWTALLAQSVTTVGAWWYDADTDRVYYKAKSGTTAFENFVVGTLVFYFDETGEVDDAGQPYDAKIVDGAVPSVKLSVGKSFKAEMSPTGTGSMSISGADNVFSRLDIEPDGDVTIEEAIEVIYV